MKPGLERIGRLLSMMADPHRGYPVIHVTGTNGKTSTARMAAAVLSAHGLQVGTFTSPHLERVEERMTLDGSTMPPEELARAIADVAPFVELLDRETGDRPTYFELLTAAAFSWFSERAVDAAVIEVGLGGRLDSTNVVESQVAVVTGVALEHTHVLGSTVAEIAAEKLAIAKPGSVLVTGPLGAEAEGVAASRAEELGVPWRRFGEDFRLEDAVMAVGGWLCDVGGTYETYPDLELRVHGRHQLENLAVAVAASEELFGRALSLDATREGVAAVRVPGRLEVVHRGPLVLIDGAHNPEAFEAMAAALEEEFPERPWRLVVGALGDKDLPRMLQVLRGSVAEVFATAPVSDRAVAPAEMAEASRTAFGPDVPVHQVESVAEAVTRALAAAGTEGSVLVTGSLYVVGEARPLLLRDPGTEGLVRAVIPRAHPNGGAHAE